MIIAAHQTMLAPPALPYDAEVEYLGFSGSQYIDTTFVPDSNTSAEIDVLFSGFDTNTYTFIDGGVGWSNNEFYIGQNPSSGSGKGRIYFVFGTNNNAGQVCCEQSNTLEGSRHVYGLINRTGYVDGVSKGTWSARSLTTTNSLYIGQVHRDGVGGAFLVGRVYAVKIWDGITLIRYFVPVRVGQVGYLYDRVSGTLFGNAGTGAFTIGPDK